MEVILPVIMVGPRGDFFAECAWTLCLALRPPNPLLQCCWLESVSELAKLILRISRTRAWGKNAPNIEIGGLGETSHRERSQAQSYFTGEISSVTSSPGNLCFWVLEGLLCAFPALFLSSSSGKRGGDPGGNIRKMHSIPSFRGTHIGNHIGKKMSPHT